jgi:hypothetical protein
MYNKLFTKILDSSIWLETAPTRIVWITFLAAMDQDGFVALSGAGNVANRARVTDQEAADAIACLEAPDVKNPDQDNEGRRVERIPGAGWIVLNAEKYRDLVRAETIREQTRERVRRFRKNKNGNGVTQCNENVTPSDSYSDSDSEAKEEKKKRANKSPERAAFLVFEEWLAKIRTDPTYSHVDFDFELGKARAWLTTHPDRKLTSRFFMNWINKLERPAAAVALNGNGNGHPYEPVYCDDCRELGGFIRVVDGEGNKRRKRCDHGKG